MPGRKWRNQGIGFVLGGEVTLEVVAGAERATGSRKQDHPHGVVHLRLNQGLDQISLEGMRHPVESLGPVEVDLRNTRRMQADFETREGT